MSGSGADRVRRVAALALVLALLAGSVWLGRGAPAEREWIIAIACGAPVVGLLAVFVARAPRAGRRALIAGALVALAARVLLMAAPYELSDDIARYQWDGRVLAHGINPYRLAPSAIELQGLRELGPSLEINHPDLHTVYPPLAQLAFALAWRIDSRGPGGFHALALIAELLTVLMLLRLLERAGLSRSRLALIALLPLALLEGYAPGHVDTLAMPLVLAAVMKVEERRPFSAGAWLALAALIKPYPLLMLPAALRELGGRGSIRLLVALAVVLLIGYAPFLGAGHWLFESMWLMARSWSFNGSVAALLAARLGEAQARVLSGVAMAGAIVAASFIARSFRRRVLLALAAFIAFTPTLYPWYLVWALPLLVLEPAPALLAIVVLSPLSYLVLVPWHESGRWVLPVWVPFVEYVPFFILLAYDASRRRNLFVGSGP